MQAIITSQQQTELLKAKGKEKLTRLALSEKLGLSRSTVQVILDAPTPLIVSGKTFTAVNNFLIDQLAKQ